LALLAFTLFSTMAAAERLEVEVGKEIVADLGGVSAEHSLSVRAGLEMLQKGGNAVDAIVAAAFANAVADHGMNGLGAHGGTMVIYLKKVGKPVVRARAKIDHVTPRQRRDVAE